MKIIWKKKEERGKKRSRPINNPNLPFETKYEEEDEQQKNNPNVPETLAPESRAPHPGQLAESFQSQGNQLAEDGKYREALGKWEAALTLTPDKAVLHEQKAQVLLELGDAWNALKAATRATQLEPSWAEAWITLARAQLNFGEPDASIESFDRALAIKPNSEDAQVDREIALNHVKKRKQLHMSGLSVSEVRFMVRDKEGIL